MNQQDEESLYYCQPQTDTTSLSVAVKMDLKGGHTINSVPIPTWLLGFYTVEDPQQLLSF